MSGFNLPPGCSVADIERAFGSEGPCDCCGRSVDDCICPECPVCRSNGDPHCYPAHGIRYNAEQMSGQMAWIAQDKQDRAIDEAYYLEIREAQDRLTAEYYLSAPTE